MQPLHDPENRVTRARIVSNLNSWKLSLHSMPVQFLFAMLRNPGSTGALVPSSRHLANAMADSAAGADHLIELGAGTGPVTAALLRRWPGVPLVAVELQPRLAHRLQRHYPGVDVRQATAKEIVDGHIDTPGRIVLVSSLPFRSLPAEIAAETIESLCAFLTRAPERRLIQFTYQPRAPFKPQHGLRWRRVTTIWRNTPPAGVWELQLDGSTGTHPVDGLRSGSHFALQKSAASGLPNAGTPPGAPAHR